MTKKILLTIIFAVISLVTFATISFAESGNTTTTLGNEVTSSMNKTERSMNDLVDKTGIDRAGSAIENGIQDVGNAISNGMDNMGRDTENFVDGTDNNDNTITDNRAVVGTTGNYTAGQIQQIDGQNGTNGMSQNAWIWIVMVVVALIIVSAVWFYAAQRD